MKKEIALSLRVIFDNISINNKRIETKAKFLLKSAASLYLLLLSNTAVIAEEASEANVEQKRFRCTASLDKFVRNAASSDLIYDNTIDVPSNFEFTLRQPNGTTKPGR